jgi:glycosyltransferase involved in cell wall biosynthesis
MPSTPDRLAPIVSIAVCTYNGERFIGAQMESLLAQSSLPDEIVLADDASTDGTCAILDAFAARARSEGIEVTLVARDQNIGFVQNFSDALLRTRGDIVFLCDQDDTWHPRKIAQMRERFTHDPALTLLHSDGELVDAELEPMGSTMFDALQVKPWELAAIHAGRAFEVLVRRSMVTGAATAFRRSLLATGLPIGQGWIHDEWLAIVAALIGKVDVLPAALIAYRQHGGNEVGMRPRTLRDRIDDLFRPRAAWLAAQIERMRELAHWADRHSTLLHPGSRMILDERIRHFAARLAIGGQPRWRRLAPVLAEQRHGRYAKFSNGHRSLLRDLLRRN